MSRPLLIGLTGGIGSGKSLLAKIFSCLGIPVYDADSRAKKLMNTDAILIDAIKKEFGNSAYQDNTLNRDFLAATVFNEEEKLNKLNSLVHPRVKLDNEEWIKANSEKKYLVKEAALLFETGSYRSLDKVIVVSAPEEVRIKRVLQRDPHRTKSELMKIIASQMRESEKLKLADYVIINDETELITPQVLKLHERFIQGINQ
jgi:dephospho-CoA kinase